MAHALEPPTSSVPDIGIAPYRLSARMRKTWDDPVLPMKRVGQELREERERSRKQLNDVWRALKVRPNYLAAIEEGRFEDLPGHAFTMGYVGRYARYLGLDVVDLQRRLEAEIAEHDGSFRRDVDIELLPNRKFPVLGVALAALLLAALIYARDDVVRFAAWTVEQAKDEAALTYKAFDAPVAAFEEPTDGAVPEPLETLAFEVEGERPVSARTESLAPLPAIAITQAQSVRPELLPPLPVVAATQPVSLQANPIPQAPSASFATLQLPMPVPSSIDVTARVSPPAELLPQKPQTPLPSGTRYGIQNRNSRITLRVHSPTIVAIRDGGNRVFIDRELAPGDTYRVPNRRGLLLTALDANAVEIVFDGTSVGFAGSQDGMVKDLSLNPQTIAARFKGSSTQSVSRPTVRATPRRATGTSRVRQRARR